MRCECTQYLLLSYWAHHALSDIRELPALVDRLLPETRIRRNVLWLYMQIGGTQDRLMPFYIGYNKVRPTKAVAAS